MAKQNNKATGQATSTPVVNKAETNRKKREVKVANFKAYKAAHPAKVPRGTARAKRREAARKSGIKAETFPELWAKFREEEVKPAQ